MMGIIPNNTGGFGDVEKTSQVFVRNELMPLQERMKEINNRLKTNIINFSGYIL